MPCANFLGGRRHVAGLCKVDYQMAHRDLTIEYAGLLSYLLSKLNHLPPSDELNRAIKHAQRVQRVNRFLCSDDPLHSREETTT